MVMGSNYDFSTDSVNNFEVDKFADDTILLVSLNLQSSILTGGDVWASTLRLQG